MGLKKLFCRGMVFCAIVLFVCAGAVFLSTQDSCKQLMAEWTDSEDFMEGNAMLSYFDRARQQDGTRQLLIGDSICNQMFIGVGEHNPHMSMLTTNAAFMITGQYLLAEEYLKHHPDATDVFLVMHPLPLTRTFDTEWSYRYGVMTYVEAGVMDLLDENTQEAMAGVYGRLFMKKELVELVENSPVVRKLYLSYINFNREDYVQNSPFEIADQYVKKLYELCRERGVTLHLYSSPVSESFREQVAALSEEYDETWMSEKFPEYFDDILYYPDAWSQDLSHFSGKYASPEMLKETAGRAYEGTDLLESLKFGREP